ncbi:hypothetical protein WRSd3_00092 [Shigella dysenteriae WRSd3]|uniref:Uncharacterized protein n=2 Tax=Shigella dysenteriae TaxID=622 RepID=A0A090NPB7_SHIDY|nr:hypothetical protein Asd1617_02736 [Shigella dysenteriae 1617]ESU82449.1 hypothetical protein WRSd3_00092 [Shigella dysenteriae WRSd3]ESU83909.1 hypothetical protein WRSd5_01309 [Shigella dysenteriae WRSd5]KGM64555.1 hypothetical protein EL77_2428 [Escherichia coli]KGM73649.1 hypothetical protein EL78_2403 [Escherichia coli]
MPPDLNLKNHPIQTDTHYTSGHNPQDQPHVN